MRCLTCLLVLCGATITLASNWCSREDADSVHAAWGQAFGSRVHRTLVAQRLSSFFVRLVQLHPDAKPLFSEVNIDDVYGPVFEAHALRVVTGIDLCINSLHDTRLLEEITAHLAMQHKQRHKIKAEFFMILRRLLRAGVAAMVDNPNIDAWDNCFTPIINAIAAPLP